MSWDISIVDEQDNIMKCDMNHKLGGGTVRCDENLEQITIREAEINITYNYSSQYAKVWEDYDGLYEMFHDKQAKECISYLQKAVELLGTTTDDDYWGSTPGNAGKAAEDFYGCVNSVQRAQ